MEVVTYAVLSTRSVDKHHPQFGCQRIRTVAFDFEQGHLATFPTLVAYLLVVLLLCTSITESGASKEHTSEKGASVSRRALAR